MIAAAPHHSLLSEHAGHLSLLLVWVGVFAAVVGRQKLTALRLRSCPLPAGTNSLLLAVCVAVAAGADWMTVGEHARSPFARATLVVLTVAQLLIAALVATRPSERLVRGVGSAGLVIALWWVAGRGLAAPGSELAPADVLAFTGQLATAISAWFLLSRSPVLS